MLITTKLPKPCKMLATLLRHFKLYVPPFSLSNTTPLSASPPSFQGLHSCTCIFHNYNHSDCTLSYSDIFFSFSFKSGLPLGHDLCSSVGCDLGRACWDQDKWNRFVRKDLSFFILNFHSRSLTILQSIEPQLHPFQNEWKSTRSQPPSSQSHTIQMDADQA